MKNLLTELRAQFSIREWLDAMKQGIKELFNQWSVREWIAAFLFYVPTAHCTSVKPGAKLLHAGGTSTEIYNALVKNEVMQINENYHRIENANMDILSSFEKKVWILLHEENKSPRTISNIFNTPLESTYQFINNIIAKLINNQETDVTDLELARMNRKLKIAEALKYARATGSNELLIMSEV